jgi:hypothetical protein
MTIYNQEFFRASWESGENAGSGILTHSGTMVAVRERERATLPGHLVGLDDDWALWRCVGLRGAGFPALQVLRLAAPECAAAADNLLRTEEEAQRLCGKAAEIVGEALNTLEREVQWHDKKRRNGFLATLRSLRAGKLPASPESLQPAEQASLETVRTALARVEEVKAEFHETFKTTCGQISKVLCEVASEERFREAVTWQNRQALSGSIAALLRMPGDSQAEGAKRRRHEAVVASYLQRYCVKNDTIGFFGPVGWATLDDVSSGLQVNTGSELLATRRVYFEDWGIDALVNTLNKNPALRRWFAPRSLPFIFLEGDTLYMPMRRPLGLAAKHAAVLRQCNGDKTAAEISRTMLYNRLAGVSSEQEVYAILEGLCSQRLILWQLELPLQAYPERRLRELLERIEDQPLRETALLPLDELERAKDAISAAAGNAANLDTALGELDDKFTVLTEQAATRAAGRTYAARTLVYEDCRRGTKVEIGSEILAELAPPLSLLLKSARWFTFEAAKVLREELLSAHRALVKKNSGNRMVDGLTFWMHTQAQMFLSVSGQNGLEAPVLNELQELFQRRWEEVLGIEEGQRQVMRRSSDVRERAETAFAAPHAGWSFGRYQSPDIMIAAADAESIRRGDYQFVMGELHLGNNTLGASVFVEQHERPQELIDAVESDMPKVRAVPMTPREWLTARINYKFISPRDYRLEFTVNSFHSQRERAIPIAELVVEETDEGLLVRTRDGRLRFDMVELFGGVFSGFVVNQFKLLRELPHTPRVTIDRLIAARETWRFAAADVTFAAVKDDADRFVAARRWAHSHSLPRFVFVKVPIETKPVYVDFDSPVFVSLLAKMARCQAKEGSEGALIAISEMVPGLDQVWLPDAEGNRYTSELRMVALDLAEIGDPGTDLARG